MTLRLNLDDVPDRESIPQGLINVMAYGFTFVGMSKITQENVDDWFIRATMHQTVNGPWVAEASGDRMLTYAEVCRFIGARANVSPMTDAAFHKWLMDTVRKSAYETMHTQRTAFRFTQEG